MLHYSATCYNVYIFPMSDIKQLAVATKIVENRSLSVSEAMQQVGYSKAYSGNPHQLTATKSWQELMDKYFPDTLVAEKHAELLNAKKIKRLYIKGEMTAEEEEVDTTAVKAGVELAYRVKGKYIPPVQKQIFEQLEQMNDDELDKIIDGSTTTNTPPGTGSTSV